MVHDYEVDIFYCPNGRFQAAAGIPAYERRLLHLVFFPLRGKSILSLATGGAAVFFIAPLPNSRSYERIKSRGTPPVRTSRPGSGIQRVFPAHPASSHQPLHPPSVSRHRRCAHTAPGSGRHQLRAVRGRCPHPGRMHPRRHRLHADARRIRAGTRLIRDPIRCRQTEIRHPPGGERLGWSGCHEPITEKPRGGSNPAFFLSTKKKR